LTGYAPAVEVAKRAGAAAVTIAGDGPALLAFGDEKRLDEIANVMVAAFKAVDVKARSWVIPIDTQGVILSVMGR
jgi:homoserine kinase